MFPCSSHSATRHGNRGRASDRAAQSSRGKRGPSGAAGSRDRRCRLGCGQQLCSAVTPGTAASQAQAPPGSGTTAAPAAGPVPGERSGSDAWRRREGGRARGDGDTAGGQSLLRRAGWGWPYALCALLRAGDAQCPRSRWGAGTSLRVGRNDAEPRSGCRRW